MSNATIRIKKRLDQGGNTAGSPSSLKPSELAFNEVDKKLYYGLGESGSNASSIIAIGGDGAFLSLSGAQTVAGDKTFSNNVVVSGNLTVSGSTTTVNSTTVSVDDKNLELGSVDTPTDTTADGGGLTLKGATDKTFNWVDSTDSWTSSEHIDLASGKVLKVAGTQVLSASNYTGTAANATNATSAASATALATGRTVGMTGDVVWTSASFDGTGNVTGTSTIQADAVDMDMLNVSGTASSTTYLRGDGAWTSISGTDTTYSISCVDGDNSDEQKVRLTAGGDGSGTDDIVLEAGTGLSVSRDGDKITFTNTVSDTNTTYTAGTGLGLSGTTFSVQTLNQDTTGTADHVTITDNESTNENNLIPFVEDAGGAGSRGLESDGDFHYNPSSGTVTATAFAGLMDGGTF
jgi:hypothetical protein